MATATATPAATTTAEMKDGFVWLDPKTLIIWQNPRTEKNVGFGIEEMGRLRDDIREKGLKLPLEVRRTAEGWTLIAGERRLRNILALLDENGPCFNRITRKTEPASVVYAKVCCVETAVADNQEAMVEAILENYLHAQLTDWEIVLQCQLLEDAGLSRKDLAKRLGKSEAWVSQTFSLLDTEKTHPKVLEAMADGVLGRTQALQFLTYPADKVGEILQRAVERHQRALDEKEAAARKDADKALADWEKYEQELADAEAAADEAKMAEARKKLSATESKMEEAEERVKKAKKSGSAKKKKPKPSIQDIQEAARDADADGSAQRHMPMKQVRQIADKLTELLDSGEEMINTETDQPYSTREVRIVRDVLDCVLSRNTLRTPLDALNVDDVALAAK